MEGHGGPLAEKRPDGEGNLAAVSGHHWLEQKHDLYGHQKCIEKGAIERREPNFTCHAQITKQQAQKEEAETLVEKVFDGSAELLFASILSDRSLSKDELARLKALVEAMEE